MEAFDNRCAERIQCADFLNHLHKDHSGCDDQYRI